MKLEVIEGNFQHLDGGAMFGNAPKEMWKQWIHPDERNRIPLACRCLLLQTSDGRNVLFETGIGAFFEPKLKERYGIESSEHLLLSNLEKKGIAEEDIDVVILSHLHFDHAGGLLAAYGEKERLLFPKAKIFVGKEHWDRAQNPHYREKASFVPQLHKLLANSNRLHLVEGESHPELDFGLQFSFVCGHTVGLMVSTITCLQSPLVFVSDLIPGMPWIHLPITMGYDRFPERGVEEKAALLESLVENHGFLYFTHDPVTPCARVCRDAKGRYFGEQVLVQTLLSSQ